MPNFKQVIIYLFIGWTALCLIVGFVSAGAVSALAVRNPTPKSGGLN